MKRVLSACLDQTVVFESREEAEIYCKQLERKRVPFRKLDTKPSEDGRVEVRMKRRYVHYPVGEYLD